MVSDPTWLLQIHLVYTSMGCLIGLGLFEQIFFPFLGLQKTHALLSDPSLKVEASLGDASSARLLDDLSTGAVARLQQV